MIEVRVTDITEKPVYEGYQEYKGVYYHNETSLQVVTVLDRLRASRTRVAIRYGDSDGKDWGEIHDVEGRISNSMGPLKIPLLIYNRSSMGGGALMDNRILRIVSTDGKTVYYQAKHYQTPVFTIEKPENPTDYKGTPYVEALFMNGKPLCQFYKIGQAKRMRLKMLKYCGLPK